MIKRSKADKNIQILKDKKAQKCCGSCSCSSVQVEPVVANSAAIQYASNEATCVIRIVKKEDDGSPSFSITTTNGAGISASDISFILEQLATKAAKKKFPFDKGFK